MSTHDLLIIIACGLLGFGIVHVFFRKPPPRPPAPPQQQAQPAPRPAPAPVPMPQPSQHWTQVLELPPTASVEEIREAYRRMIGQYHPDKVASLGRELQELAESKSRDIALAYQAALMERGNAR